MKRPYLENSDELIKEFIEATSSESDRGCMLVSHAFIDERMQEIIKDILFQWPGVLQGEIAKIVSGWSEVFTSFPRRVDFFRKHCHLSKEVARALKKFNTIRNEFAHKAHANRIVPEDVVKILDELARSQQDEVAAMTSTSHHPTHSESRERFESLIAFLWLEIEAAFIDSQKKPVPPLS